MLEAHNWKLQKKFEKMQKEVRYETYACDDAEYLLVSYGSCARIVKEAMDAARKEGLRIGLFRPATLWPFPYEALREILSRVKKVLVVEMSLDKCLTTSGCRYRNNRRIFSMAAGRRSARPRRNLSGDTKK